MMEGYESVGISKYEPEARKRSVSADVRESSPASAFPESANWAACEIFSAVIRCGFKASAKPSFVNEAIAARPYGACSGLAIASRFNKGSRNVANDGCGKWESLRVHRTSVPRA